MKTLLAKILGISRGFLEWLLPILQNQIASSLEVLAPVALSVVAKLARDGGLTSAQKREEAFKQLSEAAKAEGLSAGASVINAAIELAVLKLKAK